MEGRYTVRENGLIIAEANNLLTSAAPRAILNFLASTSGSWASHVAVGAVDTTPDVSDRVLGFEIGRGAITVRAADINNSSVLVKATIPKRVQGEIYELGVFSSPSQMGRASNQLLINDFNTEILEATNAYPVSMRIGRSGAAIDVAANSTTTATFTGMSLDLSGLTAIHNMLLACSSNGITDVEIRFMNNATDYVYHRFTPPTLYGAVTWSVADLMAINGGTLLNPFTEIQVLATAGGASGTLYLDGLRADDTDVFEEQSLVSRALLATPIKKGTSSELEIEYSIRMGF